MGLERGPLSLVSTAEELRERKNSCSGLESREYGRRDPSRWPRGTLYPQTLAVTSPTSGGRSFGIVRSLAQATESSFFSSCRTLRVVLQKSGCVDFFFVQDDAEDEEVVYCTHRFEIFIQNLHHLIHGLLFVGLPCWMFVWFPDLNLSRACRASRDAFVEFSL
jgi:hypothetical protein